MATDAQLDKWIDDLHAGERIATAADVGRLCERVLAVLLEEPNVRFVESPVTVCGDVHGQFDDVRELLRIGGSPPETSYVFLGDYVDRGRDSIETILLLFCLKARWPGHMTLLRGNHESRQITQVYGFYDEALQKYDSPHVWQDCCEVFDLLNIAAIVDGEVLCVHGGLSPQVHTVRQMQTFARDAELPIEGPLCDMLWSDPADDADNDVEWLVSTRGAGYIFGAKAVERFNRMDPRVNGLRLVARAHQLVMEGHKHHFDDRSCVTVWSAPNYCGRCGNVAQNAASAARQPWERPGKAPQEYRAQAETIHAGLRPGEEAEFVTFSEARAAAAPPPCSIDDLFS